MPVQSPSNLGITARWTASARAAESARDGRLFVDPWAVALAGEEGAAWLAQRGGRVSSMVIRTHYFDGFLQHIAYEGCIRQIVILAAGLDTRAYRLDWPEGMHLFELDQPDVLTYKDQVLNSAGAQPKCVRQSIPADLTEDWQAALIRSGFEPGQLTGWLLEGLLFYLPIESTTHIIDQVSALSAPGSWLGFDIINTVTLTSPLTHAWIEMQAREGAPWVGALDDPEAFLAERGWKASMTQPGATDANFGLWTLPVIPVKMPDMPHNWYVTAVKEPVKGC